jgi:tetratricopeptide (TPR) repeat protein
MRVCVSAATALLVCVAFSARAQARAKPKKAEAQQPQPQLQSPPVEPGPDREEQLARARAAAADRPAQSRSIYEVLLLRDPGDDEARAGLARLDLWAGHPRDAERGLREVLARHPGDAEVRASLVDALGRQERFDQAEAEADVGLAASPGDPQLLLRRARLARYRGDEFAARADALKAERAIPEDGEVRALLDSIRRGEAQQLVREEIHAGADNIHVLDLSVVQSMGRVVVGLRTEQSQRFASASPNHGYNALYAVSVGAPLGGGFSGNLELGLGSPAVAVPKRAARLGLDGPLAGPVSWALSYTLWSFTEVTAHIVQPVFSWAMTERLRLDLRYAFTDVLLTNGAGSRAANSGGAGVTFRVQPRLALSGGYFYGVQLDRGPNPGELIDVRSHFLTAGGELRLSRSLGLRPLYTLELRAQPVSETIHSLQLALYQRW